MTATRLRWVALVVLTIVLTFAFDRTGIPAGRLLGAMIAAIVLAVAGAEVRVPAFAYIAAQGIVGCLIARGVPGSLVSTIAAHWPVFIAGVLAVTILANALGWMLSRWDVFPGDAAVWGSAPGAASAMMLMAEAHGADVRLVAFMQYVRIVCVTVVASVVARLWVTGTPASAMTHAAAVHSILVAPASWAAAGATLLLGIGGAALGTRLRIPAGALLVPMIAGIALQDFAGVPIELPPAVLAVAYAVVGWAIGMRFNRWVLVTTLKSLPKVLASTLTLIALCGAFAAGLVRWAHVDPLTAYLATSPGGADSIAIIAASSAVDVPFVLTMQVLRMLFVIATGPTIARALARRLRARAA
ncbi:MAG TPA: AbrB family transcriptional regulator [Ramlibacter sp.]|nr:AbrB family transcriptional regulator [Ramlibacter sp.]